MKYLSVILVAIVLVGCQKKIETLVTETHANGMAKTKITYLGDTTHLVSVSKFYSTGKLFMEMAYQENGKLPKEEKFFYENGEVKQLGAYKSDHRAGTWQAYFPSGQLQSMRNYNDEGKEEGIYQVYSKDGDYYFLYIQGFFSNGEKRGTWKFFNKDGATIKTVNY